MQHLHALHLVAADLTADLAQQRIDEQAAAHADAAMDAPHSKLDTAGLERLTPRQHVLVHAVDQSSVEVED